MPDYPLRAGPAVLLRQLQRLLALALLVLPGAGCAAAPATDTEETARAIHARVLTLDSHVDIAREYMLKPEFDPGMTTAMKVDLEKMEQGGLDAAIFVVYVEQGPRTPEGSAAEQTPPGIKFHALRKMAEVYRDRIATPAFLACLVICIIFADSPENEITRTTSPFPNVAILDN